MSDEIDSDGEGGYGYEFTDEDPTSATDNGVGREEGGYDYRFDDPENAPQTGGF